MLFASLVSGATVLVDRGFALGLAWPALAAPGTLTLLAFLASGLLRRERLEDATIELDRNLGLSDRVTTGVAFASLEHAGPFETLALRDAEEAAATARLREGVPVRATRVYRWWPLTTAAAVALAVWLPSLTPSGVAPRAETAAQRQEREQTHAEVAGALDDAQMAVEEQPELFNEQTRRELEALERIEEELTGRDTDPREARARAAEALSNAAEQLEAEAAAEDRAARSTSERFENAGANEDPLGQALAEGDYEAAADELAAIEQRLENATPEEREQIAERLRTVAESINTEEASETPSAEDRLREQGVDPALAEELARQKDPNAVREALEEQGADPLEAQRVADQLQQDAQQREAEQQAQRNAKEFREALEQSAGECENPGSNPGQGESGGESPPPSDTSPQGGEQPGEQPDQQPGGSGGEPGEEQMGQEGSEPGGDSQQPGDGSGLQNAQRMAREMNEQREGAAQRQSAADELRQSASRMASDPTPDGGAGPEAGSAGVPPRSVDPAAPNTALRTDAVDARQGADSTRVRAEVEAEGPALPERSTTAQQATRTLQEAAPGAERALESQGVPARYRELVRRYFRQPDTAKAPALAPEQDDPS